MATLPKHQLESWAQLPLCIHLIASVPLAPLQVMVAAGEFASKPRALAMDVEAIPSNGRALPMVRPLTLPVDASAQQPAVFTSRLV